MSVNSAVIQDRARYTTTEPHCAQFRARVNVVLVPNQVLSYVCLFYIYSAVTSAVFSRVYYVCSVE